MPAAQNRKDMINKRDISRSVGLSRTAVGHMWGVKTAFCKDGNVIKLGKMRSERSLRHEDEEQ